MTETQRILITGGMGFIGSNLALRLASDGHQVTIVDSMVPLTAEILQIFQTGPRK